MVWDPTYGIIVLDHFTVSIRGIIIRGQYFLGLAELLSTGELTPVRYILLKFGLLYLS